MRTWVGVLFMLAIAKPALAEKCPRQGLAALATESPDDRCKPHDRFAAPIAGFAVMRRNTMESPQWMVGFTAGITAATWHHPRGRLGPSHVSLGGRATYLEDTESDRSFVALEAAVRASFEPQALRGAFIPFFEVAGGRVLGRELASQTIITPGLGVWIAWWAGHDGGYVAWSIAGAYQLPLGSWDEVSGLRASTQLEVSLW